MGTSSPALEDTPSKNLSILALIPSEGHGGGIEAYVDALLQQAQKSGVIVRRCVLTSPRGRLPPSLPRKLVFAWNAVRAAWNLRSDSQAHVFAFLPSLAGLGLLARVITGRRRSPVTVFFHGSEIWAAGSWARWVWARRSLRLISVSSFSAGALARVGAAQILPPGIPSSRYSKLHAIPPQENYGRTEIRVLSVFRLPEAELKGGFVVLDAIRELRAEGVDARVTFAGFGAPPKSFVAAIRKDSLWAELVRAPSEEELVHLYSAANLFVLATRLRSRPVPSGEGFGIVLVEAALAGRVVVAPAFGGSADAILGGVTGVRPRDESVDSLVEVLHWCVANPDQMRLLATNARTWATERFRPEVYGRVVSHILFGDGFEEQGNLALVTRIGTPGARPRQEAESGHPNRSP